MARSVLDLAPVVAGSTPAAALANSADLAVHAERLGYHRYWVAEHHNLVGIASSSPPVLMAHLAATTSTIRIGSGGLMLPNHAPLVVAEQFGMLEALHPGRIDLGIGRAPGTDPLTARAVRDGVERPDDDFPRQLGELLGFFNGSFSPDHPYRSITATPALGYRPEIWLLGSSEYSAQVAAWLGLPFSFAHHFSPRNTSGAMARYRAEFRPSPALAEPHVSVGVSIIVGEDDGHAQWLASSSRLSYVCRRTGRPAQLTAPDEAAGYRFNPVESELLETWEASNIVGGPRTVRAGLDALVDETGAAEIMVLTSVHSHVERVKSYERLAGT